MNRVLLAGSLREAKNNTRTQLHPTTKVVLQLVIIIIIIIGIGSG
jgi:hypothetical protein